MKKVSFVIPVFNEQQRIAKTFKSLKKDCSFNAVKVEQIIFVNDGSIDNTLSLIKSEKDNLEDETEAKIKIVSYPTNKGKGYAIKQGMLASKSDYTLFFDADMATPLCEFKKFIPFIKKGKDIIIGTRKNGKSTVVKHQPFYRENMGKVFTLLANVILNTWVTDFTCGFKAFSYQAKQDVFEKSKINGWGYDAEILFLAKKLGYEITEKAVVWEDDNRTKVNLIKDSINSFWELIRIRFNWLSNKIKQTVKTPKLAKA